jgi:large subunit ribosomal protein L24
MRNQQNYQAVQQIRSKRVGTNMSKQLRQKYTHRSIRIVTGDTVKVVRGEYKGIEGKVTKIIIDKSSIAIEGIKKEKLKGGKFDILIHSSNVIITSLNTDDKWRVRILENKSKPKTESKPEPEPEAKSEPATKKVHE